ncbi:GNAT family N-acetyltransferase [Nocardia sp. XZ_19_385]|uniref:GNAT family N-acetyltransferase n=1 Tax=Nocardia sp. XZ_19_385 TaxID=2769488 RepID=UPI0028154E3A|nr:GNAT family N-acetyltransferase [Nocardia sp. XZ_19_385]
MVEAAPMVMARPADAVDIAALRDRLAQWMIDNGIAQWLPGEYTVDRVAAEVARGEWFLWREGAQLIATVRLIWRDPEFWGADDAEAGYIHGLMVAPEQRGRELGARIIQFCAERTLAQGITRQRLDAAADNQVLRKYYATQGFTELREAPLPPEFQGTATVLLFEKDLAD